MMVSCLFPRKKLTNLCSTQYIQFVWFNGLFKYLQVEIASSDRAQGSTLDATTILIINTVNILRFKETILLYK